MKNLINNQLNESHVDEIDLHELFHILWKMKYIITIVTSAFIVISIVFALMMPNIYRSSAIMMPVEVNAGMSGMLGQYSGMASLAGISLPSETGSKAQEAIARIQSFEFFSNHFLPNIALEDFMAVKKWNPASNNLIYDEKDFNPETLQWVRKIKPPRSTIPSTQEAYEEYLKIMRINEDKKTLFVSLSVEHESPFVAHALVELIINKIDQVMRDEDRHEATKSIEYLNSIVSRVNYEEIKKALSSLQQEQMKRLMMVEASENYIFKVLDSPIVPEIKSEPSRSLIVILGAILGLLFSILGSFIYHYIKNPFEHNELEKRH